jgi:hypothetical protein
VLINQKISVGSIFVLADARFDDWRILKSREAAGNEIAGGFDGGHAGDAGLRIGICRSAVMIVSNFQAAIFQIGHAVKFIFQVEPSGQGFLAELNLSLRDSEKNNFLARNEDARAQEFGE